MIGVIFTLAKDIKSMQSSIESTRILANDTAVATSISFTYLSSVEEFKKYTELYLQELKKANNIE